MGMHRFERWAVNALFSPLVVRPFLVARLFALDSRPPAGRGIGLGTGCGADTLAIARRYPAVEIVAIDYDPAQVALARRAAVGHPAARRVTFLQGDATKLDFPDASFDFAYELNAFHHIRDYPSALREVARALCPGGRFFFQDLSDRFFRNPVLRWLFPPEALFSRARFLDQVQDAGLRIEGIRGGSRLFMGLACKPEDCAGGKMSR